MSVLVWYLLCEGLGQCLDELARPLQLIVFAVLELEQMLEEGTATHTHAHADTRRHTNTQGHCLSPGSHEGGCVGGSR